MFSLSAAAGDRQHAIIFPRVRSSKLEINCSPMPRDAPLTTNTALESEFLLSEFALSPLLKLMWGKTGCPCDSGGSGASNEDAIADDEEECDRVADR